MTSTRTNTTRVNHHHGTLVALLTALALAVSLLLTQAQNALAAFPGQNGKIVFESSRDGNSEIYSMNTDGTGQTRLTFSPGSFEGEPNFSPNGRRVAFTSTRDGNEQVYVMDFDGSGQKRLTNNGAFDGLPDWGVALQE